ncbi:DUF302 domain-containing protein [Ilumatobacter sp.]|uniref:DUF302 domain-containing protein n=1 Tax=Ilumatobacter sp. TaxID=1967498 RepID=UPI003C3477BB
MKRTTLLPLLTAVGLAVTACTSSDSSSDSSPTTLAPEPAATDAPTTSPVGDQPPEQVDPNLAPGVLSQNSTQSFDDSVAALTTAIEGNEALTLVATIDHAANAASVGLDLAPTTELIFGNPMLGTPLMQANPGTGLDLPQKILITEDDEGAVDVYWNSAEYLRLRHGLTGVDEQLTTIADALTTLGNAAAGTPDALPFIGVPAEITESAGITSASAPGTARDAADRLIAAIDANPDLVLVAEIDHQANAGSAGLELQPIIEVIFGNPNIGTPLMQANRTVGIDLPQKMLFVEGDGGVTITYNDPTFIAERHGIDPSLPQIDMATGALAKLATAAAG